MSNELDPRICPVQPVVFQIRVRGHLDTQWSDWFGGLSITLEENGTTLLTGPVVDQASLHGLLKKIRDLGMPLLSICPVQPGASAKPDQGATSAPEVKSSKRKLKGDKK